VGSSETEYLEHKNLEEGQAGNGINQLDIVAIEDGQAAIMNEAYAPGAGSRLCFSVRRSGSVASFGGDRLCGSSWLRRFLVQS
jgi:hypothetical protein